MAFSVKVFLFSSCLLITLSLARRPILPINGVIFPVRKDDSTLQYVAQIHKGTPLVPIELVVDLGGPFLWVNCGSGHVSPSVSHRTIPCGSLQCLMAKAGGCTEGKIPAALDRKACSLYPVNTVAGKSTTGELAEDAVAIAYADGPKMGSITTVHSQFLFSCSPKSLIKGLADGARGMLGLGKSRISLPSQLSNELGFHRKFSVCLSSSNGFVIAGDGPHVSSRRGGISNSLIYTPLILRKQDNTFEDHDYYINVKSIKINGKRLMGSIAGSTQISTVVPYTTMKTPIYKAFTKSFAKEAASMNLTVAAQSAPFELCYNYGLSVPIVDLVLQSEMVKWRIHGRNSMVRVSKEVMCLGFLDGGLDPRSEIVIGGHQLEENLLEFNLGTSMLGFSSWLSTNQTTCSQFNHHGISSV